MSLLSNITRHFLTDLVESGLNATEEYTASPAFLKLRDYWTNRTENINEIFEEPWRLGILMIKFVQNLPKDYKQKRWKLGSIHFYRM